MGTIYYQGQQYLGGTGQTYGGTTPPSSSLGNNGDYYYLIGSNGKASIVYVKLNNSWIEIYGGDVTIINHTYGGNFAEGYDLNTMIKDIGKSYYENAMSESIDANGYHITWNQQGAYIGYSFNGNIDLTQSSIKELSYKINFGTCYDNVNNQNIRPFIIGITDTIRTTSQYVSPTNVDQYFTTYKI